MKRFIVTGQSDFKKLREADGVYVDKTKQIYDCLSNDVYYFLARPRRFGKSILCTTLRELFLGNRALFKGLWIDGSDWKWEAHPVVHLSMAKLAMTATSTTNFEANLREHLADLASQHKIAINTVVGTGLMFGMLLERLHAKYGKTVVVIIDEYDKPILDLIGKQQDYTEVHWLLKSFYGQLKHQEEHLRFVFITGIYKFTKTSIFSDLNNLRDLTLLMRTYDLIGYTQDELEANFSPEIDLLARESNNTRAALLEKLRISHNGYIFGINQNDSSISPSVYNSYVVNMLFAEGELKSDIWFSSGTPTMLIKQLESKNFAPLSVEHLEILVSNLINSCEPGQLTVETLLYFAGYLTIKSYSVDRKIVQLRPPNLEVAQAMAQEILPRMSSFSKIQWQKIALEVRDALLAVDFERFQREMTIAFACIHHKLFTKDESFYQTVMAFTFQQAGLEVDVEPPTNIGYIDLVVYGPQAIFILELKLDRTAQQAINQIKEKKYFQGLLAKKKPIYLVGINCTSEVRNVTQIIGEKLV